MPLVSIIILIILTWVIYAGLRFHISGFHYIIALTLKLIAGILVGLIYFYYYQAGDTIVYHQMAFRIVQDLGNSFHHWAEFIFTNDLSNFQTPHSGILNEPRSLFFIKVISILYLLTDSNYWISGLFLSLFSFLGSWYLAGKVLQNYPGSKTAVLISLFYFPSIIFWSSGILKETLAWPCIAILSAIYIQVYKEKEIKIIQIILGIILFAIAWKLKYHYAVVWLLCAISASMFSVIKKYFPVNFYQPTFVILILIFAFALSFVHPNFHLENLMHVITANHEKILSISGPGNTVDFIHVGNQYLKFFVNLPVSLFAGLFLPFPWQGSNQMIIIVGSLNFLVFTLFLFKIFEVIRSGKMQGGIAFGITYYIIILSILMAYTTPNFGTLERYKISYLPFFLIWILNANPVIRKISSSFIN